MNSTALTVPVIKELTMRPFNIWSMRSVDGKQSVTVAKPHLSGSQQNEYCRIVYTCDAWNEKEALRLYFMNRMKPISIVAGVAV